MADPPIEGFPDGPAGAVAVAYCHGDDVAFSWHHSLVEMIGWDMANSARVLRGGWIAIRTGTDGLVEARNKAVRIFLEENPAEWLFWLDTDMGFGPDIIDRLVEAADPAERPIVGALAFSYRQTEADGMGGWRCRPTPTVFEWAALPDGQMGFTVRWGYPDNTVVRCAGTGSACVLIHRSALERIGERFGDWYARVPNTSTGQVVSEDLAFCMRAGALGIPVHVHTGVKTTHQKRMWVAELDYLRSMSVPPATERVAVLVPVLRRPQNAEPFMRSLRASTGLATVYAVCSVDDPETAAAWNAAGAQVLRGDDEHVHGEPCVCDEPVAHTFAEKVNLGYRQTSEPWLFLVGDDVRFRSGWLDYAQEAGHAGAHVIGTNDLGNPRVMAGDHATHLLIHRSYIDEVGASWDGPKTVAHEGYRHWYVDDEIVAAAKARGVWAMARESVVEHMHPLFGKAPDDEVYALGQASAEQDKALFDARAAEFL